MQASYNEIENYARLHSSYYLEPLLEELERKTHLEVMYPQMLSGKIQGQLLAFLSNMKAPKRILEIGTYTGYSAICLAQGLVEGGQLHTIEINAEILELAQGFFKKAGLDHTIIQHHGPAFDVLKQLEGPWDLVFLDADKLNYAAYYDWVFEAVPSGGLIIADNVLWKGMVIHAKEKRAKALAAFNEKINKDVRVKNILLPLRDGLMIMEKA